MPIQIRSATPADSDAVAALLGELGYPTTSAAAQERIRQALSPDYLILVSVADNDVVGLASACKVRVLHDDQCLAFITAMVVARSAQRQGIGRALLTKLEDWARENQCARLLVTSAARRTDAHAFYQQMQYAQTGIRFGKSVPATAH